MKKTFSIFLAFVFLISTSGFAVNIHYCPIKKKTSYGALETHKKSCSGKNDLNDKCCKHETKFFKVKTDFSSVPAFSIPEQKTFTTLFSVASIIEERTFDFSHFIFYTDSSPPALHVSRTILFRSILI